MVDTDKLMELIEECFDTIREQNKTIENKDIEIESLKLKLRRKPKVEIREVKEDELYNKYRVRFFEKLKSDSIKDKKEIERLKDIISNMKITNKIIKEFTV